MTTPATTPADGEIDIDALERLARAATPGPWYCHKKDEEAGEFLMDFGGIFNADGTPNYESRNAMSGWISLRDRDAPYIAAANPETVLSLIGRIRELESALATPSPSYAYPCQPFAIVTDRTYNGEGPTLAVWNGENYNFSDGDCFEREFDGTLDGYEAEWLTHYQLEQRLFATPSPGKADAEGSNKE